MPTPENSIHNQEPLGGGLTVFYCWWMARIVMTCFILIGSINGWFGRAAEENDLAFPGFRVLAITETIAGFALQLHAFFVYRWFWMYGRKGPNAVIGNLIGCLISAFVLSLWASVVLDKPLADILPTYWPTFITALIWIPYFLFSNRVKLTFGPISLAATNVELPVDLAGAVQSPATAKSQHATSRRDDEIYLLTDADSRRPTAPNALSNIVKADHDALVTDEELLAEGRNEMPPSSASKAPTRRRRIWFRQLLVACLLLVVTDVLRDLVTPEFVMNEEDAQKATRQEALAKHLENYDSDPMSQMLGTGDFSLKEYDAEQAKRKTERDKIIGEYPDDPMAQALAVADYHLKQRAEAPAKRAFAERELLERLKRVDQQSRKLDSITPNNAFIREPVGAVLNVAPDILSIVAWLTGNGEVADELHRQSQEFQLARRELRQGAPRVFYDEGSKPTGSSPPATPGSSVAQPRTEPSATPQVEDAPPRTPEELLEEQMYSSPIMQRALRRRRIEDLVSEGKSQAEAEKTAIKEQEGRAVTPNNAQVRETVGGALNATPDLAAVVARLTAEKEAADRKRLSAKEVYDNAKNSVVFVTVFDGTNTEPIGAGTGFVVSEDGLIATNFHVIEGARIATVSFADGRVLTVEGVVGVNRVADLALLKVGGTNLSFLKLGSKELPQVGNDVYALGNPRGRTHTLSPGIVTRESEWTGYSTRIQTNAAISPGSSGGPLLDEYGTVVGITTGFILDSQNLNLAVPVELLARLLAGRGEVQSLADAARNPIKRPEPDLKILTEGMLVGRAFDDDIYDIVFPGDMLPDMDVFALAGKSAQLVCAIRIAENQPIMMIKLVHFSQGEPLGVFQIAATSGPEQAIHRFAPEMISRQSQSGVVIEFATLVPFVDPSASRLLAVIRDSPACNIEAMGTRGFTTFSPGITARQHADRMVSLFHALRDRPTFVLQLQQRALSFEEFQRELLK